MARVGEERQGVGENPEDDLGRHEGEQEGERERQEPAIAARRVRGGRGRARGSLCRRLQHGRDPLGLAADVVLGGRGPRGRIGTRQPGGGAQADLDRLG